METESSCALHVVHASDVYVLVFSKTNKCQTFFVVDVFKLNKNIKLIILFGPATCLSFIFTIEAAYACSVGPELLSSGNRF